MTNHLRQPDRYDGEIPKWAFTEVERRAGVHCGLRWQALRTLHHRAGDRDDWTSDTWCGYVQVPPGREGAFRRLCGEWGYPDLAVHGGVTWAGRQIGVLPGGNRRDLWFGFDCRHAGDLESPTPPPVIGAFWREFKEAHGYVWRDGDYTEAECKRLAEQMAAVPMTWREWLGGINRPEVNPELADLRRFNAQASLLALGADVMGAMSMLVMLALTAAVLRDGTLPTWAIHSTMITVPSAILTLRAIWHAVYWRDAVDTRTLTPWLERVALGAVVAEAEARGYQPLTAAWHSDGEGLPVCSGTIRCVDGPTLRFVLGLPVLPGCAPQGPWPEPWAIQQYVRDNWSTVVVESHEEDSHGHV